jgi:hypothetical protein
VSSPCSTCRITFEYPISSAQGALIALLRVGWDLALSLRITVFIRLRRESKSIISIKNLLGVYILLY